MDHRELLSRLASSGLNTFEEYSGVAFARNIGLLTLAEQAALGKVRVAIPGLGGVGGVHLVTLVRSGIGRFHLADFDTFDPVNVNRQYGATVPAFGRPKLEVMVEQARCINPFVEIQAFPEGLTRDNLDGFLEGVDVVVDSLDFFEFDLRRLLFNRARDKGIHVVTAGPMGFSSAMLIFSPEGMGFDDYFDVHDWLPDEDKYLRYALGLSPRPTHLRYLDRSKVDLQGKRGPSLGIACQLCAAMAATEVVRIVLKRGGIKPAPHYFQFDPYRQKYRKGYLRGGNRKPFQRAKIWFVKKFLLKTGASTTPPPMPATGEDGAVSQAMLEYIVKAGIQAPSGDNAQPWRFAAGEGKVELFLDPTADTSFFNVRQIASTIACGAALENMRLAATAFGLEGRATLLPSPDRPELMASLELSAGTPGSLPTDPLQAEIWRRCTNRRPYAKTPVPEEILSGLEDAATSAGARLYVLTDRGQIRKLARIVYKADRIRTEHRGLHEHLMRMVRFTGREVYTSRDGLPLRNLEAGAAGEAFLRLTRPWAVMDTMNRIGLGRLVALHSAQALLRSGAAALLTVPGMAARDFLAGGQALERVWLELSRQGLQMQPMTAITLFWLRWVLEGRDSFAPEHVRLLESVWGGYRGLFPQADFGHEGQVMLFRLGYGPEARVRTLRKAWE